MVNFKSDKTPTRYSREFSSTLACHNAYDSVSIYIYIKDSYDSSTVLDALIYLRARVQSYYV